MSPAASASFSPATAVAAALDALGLSYSSERAGAYLVRLEGQHKLATMTWLIVGAHSLALEAFLFPAPGREPRRVLPVPARAQRAHVRGPLQPRPGRRRLPDRPAAAIGGFY